jgi:hypothetical protein
MTVLNHEKNWIRWKSESCQSFEKPSVPRMERSPRTLAKSQACDPGFLGNDDMTTLWKQATNLEERLCKNAKASRKLVKTLDETLQELNGQVDSDLETPLDGLEKEYILYNQMHFNWLSYRIAMRTHLKMFQHYEFDSHVPGKSLLGAWRLQYQEKRQADMEIDVVVKKPKLDP